MCSFDPGILKQPPPPFFPLRIRAPSTAVVVRVYRRFLSYETPLLTDVVWLCGRIATYMIDD